MKLDSLSTESELARLRGRANGHLRGHKRWYEKNRLLENKIRNCCAGTCGHKTSAQCLNNLSQYIPINPRKKWSWRNVV